MRPKQHPLYGDLGKRLVNARKRSGLSQEALAETIGSAGRSMSRWECNQAIPQHYYLERLCQALQISIEELLGVQGDEQPQTPSPQFWHVPYPRNPHFTGRDELLEELTQHLFPERSGELTTSLRAALTQPQAIKGLGGIGKTQIAVEYR